MKLMKKCLAVFMAALLIMPGLSASAGVREPADAPKIREEADTAQAIEAADAAENRGAVAAADAVVPAEDQKPTEMTETGEAASPVASAETDQVLFNTGNHVFCIVPESVSMNGTGDGFFEEDGSYTIHIPEDNPFFPYEVQFTHGGEVFSRWFMTPDDSVEVGGHIFYVDAWFDGVSVTRMNLCVAGEKVPLYPEKKRFDNSGDGTMPISLLPLEERRLHADLTAYTPAELTRVAVEIFAGTQAKEGDQVVWTYSAGDDYTVNLPGDQLDLSSHTYNSSRTTWQMIVGDGDQLAASNIRCIVDMQLTSSKRWLLPMVYSQNSAGRRSPVSVVEFDSVLDAYYDYNKNDREMRIRVPEDEVDGEVYISLKINKEIFPDTAFDHFRVYEGQFADAAEALAGKDITAQVFCENMTQRDAGYRIPRSTDRWVTLVTFDAGGNVTGCLPFQLYWQTASNYVRVYGLYDRSEGETGGTSVTDKYSRRTVDGAVTETRTLYKGYAANGIYHLVFNYYVNNSSVSNALVAVTAAYAGTYSSIAQASAAGAVDIKETLFGQDSSGGYAADYSGGVDFTVFVGEDGSPEQEIYHYKVITKEGETPPPAPSEVLGSGTWVSFYGLNDRNGKWISAYRVDSREDDYGEYTFLTFLVGADQDVTDLAPVFYTEEGLNLRVSGSTTAEVSGESFHDFSQRPVQYTAYSEDGENQRNYWLQVVKATEGAGRIYINSLADASAGTRWENGVAYSTREMMLDGYHGYKHDIFIANMGTQALEALSVDLQSDAVELDDYWTLSGDYDLAGFSGTWESSSYGELWNLAKIRVKAKDGMEAGADVAGTLTVKAGETVLAVLTLTGTVGDPCITTEEIPQAVKYVPYGAAIQNNNKYSWNRVTYSWMEGELPQGMTVRPNGELYGVPMEAGEFAFTVRMNNGSSFRDSTKTYTLVVKENTDENVNAATDAGYELTKRVQPVYLDSLSGGQILVSQGNYGEFQDIYLDGVKLAEGEDYISESGSTRITILEQTLANNTPGTHTLGLEFRTEDTETLNRAAQNYTVEAERPGEDDGGDGSGSGSGGSHGGEDGDGGGSGSGSGGNGKSNLEIALSSGIATAVSYTVEAGDTLWKIAKKYYGSGIYWQKIYEDNASVISDPDRIYVGQKLTIYSYFAY